MNPQSLNTIFRQQYAQNDEWIEAFLSRSQIGHVASRWENQPFLTPVLFWYEAQKRRIYFHTNLYQDEQWQPLDPEVMKKYGF